MTAFSSLPVFVQNLCCFFALLCCFLLIADTMLLARQRRPVYAAVSAVLLAFSYGIMHICLDLSGLRLGRGGAPAAQQLGALPWPLFPAFLLLIAACGLWQLRDVRAWRRSHISRASIKESLDELPAGICYYTEEGRCILVNHRMNDICFQLFGRDLQDGLLFGEQSLREPVRKLPDGSAVSFRHRVLDYEGAPLHELIADDISELYEKRDELSRDVERAARLKESMDAYGRTIDDAVRENEILQARISIHDGLNQMLLATRRVLQDGSPKERDGILSMWRNESQLLRSEAPVSLRRDMMADLDTLASVIGLRIDWRSTPDTEDPAALTLFLLAAREALANAAKHAAATELIISTKKEDGMLYAVFENNGTAPLAVIEEKGGLANLRRRVEEAGGSVSIETEPRFRLSVTIPAGGDLHGL